MRHHGGKIQTNTTENVSTQMAKLCKQKMKNVQKENITMEMEQTYSKARLRMIFNHGSVYFHRIPIDDQM